MMIVVLSIVVLSTTVPLSMAGIDELSTIGTVVLSTTVALSITVALSTIVVFCVVALLGYGSGIVLLTIGIVVFGTIRVHVVLAMFSSYPLSHAPHVVFEAHE
jgi:hypothetical protein